MSIDKSQMDVYQNGKLVKKGKSEDDSLSHKLYWWKANTEEQMSKEIQGSISFMAQHQGPRTELLTEGSRLYGQSSSFNFIGPALSRSASFSGNSNSTRLSFNLCSSVIDTLTAKVAKNKVIPMYITEGGVWGKQKQAEQLSKFIEGMFYEHDVHKLGTYAFRDSGMWGDGLLKIFEDGDKVGVERSFPHMLFIDEKEALTGSPRQMHEVKIADRDIVMEMYGDTKESQEKIRDAGTVSYVDLGAEGTTADLVVVTESWHLRSGEEAEDGLKVICIGDKVIDKVEWNKDYFPFPQIQYCKRPTGHWGQGACERLRNLQGEINRNMIVIQRSLWMSAGGKIAVPIGSKVPTQHLNNDIWSIYFYSGDRPPTYMTPPCVQPEVYQWVDSLIAKGYQQEGVSQLSANSMKPAGVNSGQALRTYDEIADDRFLFTMQNMEQFYLEVARQMIEVVKDIYKRKKTYKVTFPATRFIQTIDWKDINLKEDEYVLKAFPTSSLPDDPAGKLQTIQEYMQAGILSPRQGRRLMSMPDLEMSDKLANAAEELICRTIEDMLDIDDPKYRGPEPYWDLQLARTLGLEYWNYAELNDCPKERLADLKKFMDTIDDITQVSAPPAPPPQPGAAPMANPTPTPTSALLPNTPGAIQ